jgi:glyoxylase-like metal-dependent hydrolase (beta-lactamase superfamily II)
MRTKRFRAAVVVDAGTLPQADAVVDAIRKIISQPIRYVIDTSDVRTIIHFLEDATKP